MLTISALEGLGLDELWATIRRHRQALEAAGELAAKRRAQQVRWMWSTVEQRLLGAFRASPEVRALLAELGPAVADGRVPAGAAADRLLTAFGVGGDDQT